MGRYTRAVCTMALASAGQKSLYTHLALSSREQANRY